MEYFGRAAACLQPARLYSAINALQLPLGNRDRTLGVFAAGAVVGEHVDDEEVGDRGRRLLAGRADAGSGKRTLTGVTEHFVLRIGLPHRSRVVAFERVGEITPRTRQPLVVVFLLQHEGDE